MSRTAASLRSQRQYGLLQTVCDGVLKYLHEWRHRDVRFGSFPQRTLLGLEAERRQRAIECTGLGDAAGEEVASVRQQVCSHERAVAVASHCDLRTVNDPTPNDLLQFEQTAQAANDATLKRGAVRHSQLASKGAPQQQRKLQRLAARHRCHSARPRLRL